MLKVSRRTPASTGATRNGRVLAGNVLRPSKLVDDLQINLVGRKGIGREIYSQLLLAIQEGRLEPGRRLPPTRELARRLKVARTTVALAYDRLAGEGLLVSRVGAGTFVKQRRVQAIADAQHQESPLSPKQGWADVPVAFIRKLFASRFEFDFRTGIPDVSAFPHARWRRLMARHLHPSKASTGYGDPAGHPALRAAIARHIWLSRGMEVDPESVTVTNGTQQALDLITKILVERGDRVAVEDPGYPPAWRLFRAIGARVEPVPVDNEGLTVSALPSDTRLVYVTPSHQFPMGVTMSLERRAALLEWARRANAVLVEDDYDGEFRFGDRPLEPLRALDTTGRVIYVGSFSKSALPSLRLGFLITPTSLTAAIRAAKYLSDWHTIWAVQGAFADFIEEGWYARHVRRMRREYEGRHSAVVNGLDSHFRTLVKVAPSAVGLHVCALATQLSPSEIHSAVTRAVDVGVDELARYSVGQPVSGLLFGYGAIPAARIDEGLRRLKDSFVEDRS
jgi:GntR family transcriptional regulator/MocR family aminotransferase